MPYKISQLFDFDLVVTITWLWPIIFNQKYSQKWSIHFITKGFTTFGQSSLLHAKEEKYGSISHVSLCFHHLSISICCSKGANIYYIFHNIFNFCLLHNILSSYINYFFLISQRRLPSLFFWRWLPEGDETCSCKVYT